MTTREERMNDFNNPDNHDSAEDFLKAKDGGAEFYKNNKVENFTEETGGKVRNILNKVAQNFNLKKDFNEIIKDLNEKNISFEEYERRTLDHIIIGDEQWKNEKHWQKEKARAMKELEAVTKEYKLISEKDERPEVTQAETDFKNDSIEQLYDRMGRSGKNHAEACINILYNRNELQFDNPQLWKALENLSNNQVSFQNAQELSWLNIQEKIKEVVELIWTKEEVRKWGIEDKKNYRTIRMNVLGDDHDDASSFFEKWEEKKAA